MSRLQKLQLERNAAWNLGGFPQTQKILKLRSTQRPATRRRRRRSRPWRSLEPSIAQPRHGFATQKSWKSRNPRYDERTLGRPPWDEAAIAEDDGIHNFGSFAYHIISYLYIYVCVCANMHHFFQGNQLQLGMFVDTDLKAVPFCFWFQSIVPNLMPHMLNMLLMQRCYHRAMRM
jgi:hypothetical protein